MYMIYHTDKDYTISHIYNSSPCFWKNSLQPLEFLHIIHLESIHQIPGNPPDLLPIRIGWYVTTRTFDVETPPF